MSKWKSYCPHCGEEVEDGDLIERQDLSSTDIDYVVTFMATIYNPDFSDPEPVRIKRYVEAESPEEALVAAWGEVKSSMKLNKKECVVSREAVTAEH